MLQAASQLLAGQYLEAKVAPGWDLLSAQGLGVEGKDTSFLPPSAAPSHTAQGLEQT